MLSKRKLLINTLAFSILLEIIAVIMTVSMSGEIITPALPFLVPFFFSVSILSNLWLLSVPAENPNKFVRIFMMATFLKFFLYIIVLVAYVMLQRDDAVRFMFSFLVLFVLFLVFDVIILLQSLPKKK
ncbi:MAG TPA: hypothetical protein PKI01_00895 [Bacteroidales bacterium]|nr:hypothetical protein [Bacteroidales bacterium]